MNRYLFIQKVNKYEVVSFDIFDTLVQRRVLEPTNVFYCAASRCLSDVEARQFRLDRMEAERQARVQSSNKEIDITEIYQVLKNKYGKLTDELMQCEIREEIAQCTGIIKNIELTKLATTMGKRVILISDMYLSERTIYSILQKCQINSYEKLFLSNQYNAVKSDGSLFAAAMNSMNIRSDKIIHFGDSIKADYYGAHKQGIESVLVHRRGRVKRMLYKWKK